MASSTYKNYSNLKKKTEKGIAIMEELSILPSVEYALRVTYISNVTVHASLGCHHVIAIVWIVLPKFAFNLTENSSRLVLLVILIYCVPIKLMNSNISSNFNNNFVTVYFSRKDFPNQLADTFVIISGSFL